MTDLLRDGAPIGSDAADADNFFHAHRWVLDGRVDVPLTSSADALRLLAAGEACKRQAATKMNQRSSRAHALFILRLTQERDGVQRSSRLILADLGGSEKLGRSGAVRHAQRRPKASGKTRPEAASG